jgi:hypothetical protein
LQHIAQSITFVSTTTNNNMIIAKYILYKADGNIVKTNYSFIDVVEASGIDAAKKHAKKIDKSIKVEMFLNFKMEFDVNQGYITQAVRAEIVKKLSTPTQVK